MNPEIKAVIDLGTNSVKLLVASVTPEAVTPVLDATAKNSARLGTGLYLSRSLQPESMNAAIFAIKELIERAAHFQPQSIRLVATSAVRDALNRGEFEALVLARTGLPLEVISGVREAELVHRGVASDPAITGKSLVILDVGGGSTELIVSSGDRIRFRRSYQLGTVRFMEMLPMSDPPTAGDRERCTEFLEQFFTASVAPDVRSELGSAAHDFQFFGTGGTAICLATMQAGGRRRDGKIPTLQMSRSEVHFHTERLWQLSLRERKLIAGLPEKRADVILTGAAIFDTALACLDFDSLTVSRRGLRCGALASESATPADRDQTARISRPTSIYGKGGKPPATRAALNGGGAVRAIRTNLPGANSRKSVRARARR